MICSSKYTSTSPMSDSPSIHWEDVEKEPRRWRITQHRKGSFSSFTATPVGGGEKHVVTWGSRDGQFAFQFLEKRLSVQALQERKEKEKARK